MSGALEVCDADALGPGERRIVETDAGRTVGVFNVDGEYHAIANVCLHQRGPVCEGNVERKVVGEHPGIGERVEERYGDEPVVKCPWHGWEYELRTGALVNDGDRSIPVYDVLVEDGTVYVEV